MMITNCIPNDRKISDITHLVIHSMGQLVTGEKSTVPGTIEWFKNPKSNVSAHYLMGLNGQLTQLYEQTTTCWHCKALNKKSLGIELEGSFEDDFTLKQKLYLNDFIDFLKIKIPHLKIVGHGEINQTECPGKIRQEWINFRNTAKPSHWAQEYYDDLIKSGIKIEETGFDDNITRGEVFKLLSQIKKSNI